MKKITKLMIIALLAIIPFVGLDAKTAKTTTTTTAATRTSTDPINVYVFYGSTCPHCEELIEYIHTTLRANEELAGKFNVVYYEVWNNATNASLMSLVATELGTTANGVPFMVIGDKYYSGYSESRNTAIESAIASEYTNADYVDVVAKVEKANETEGQETNPEESFEDTTETDDKKSDIVAYVVLGVTLVAIVAIVYFKKNSESATYYDEDNSSYDEYDEEELEYDEDDDEDEETEEVVEEKVAKKEAPKKSTKATAKKTTAKKSTKSTKKSTTKKKTSKK